MRFEFLAEGASDCPLILMTCKNEQEVPVLAEALRRTSSGPVELHRLPGIEAKDGLTLVAIASRANIGVRVTKNGGFEWALNPDGWEEVVGLLEPFTMPSEGKTYFQFLNRFEGPKVIISTTGRW